MGVVAHSSSWCGSSGWPHVGRGPMAIASVQRPTSDATRENLSPTPFPNRGQSPRQCSHMCSGYMWTVMDSDSAEGTEIAGNRGLGQCLTKSSVTCCELRLAMAGVGTCFLATLGQPSRPGPSKAPVRTRLRSWTPDVFWHAPGPLVAVVSPSCRPSVALASPLCRPRVPLLLAASGRSKRSVG